MVDGPVTRSLIVSSPGGLTLGHDRISSILFSVSESKTQKKIPTRKLFLTLPSRDQVAGGGGGRAMRCARLLGLLGGPIRVLLISIMIARARTPTPGPSNQEVKPEVLQARLGSDTTGSIKSTSIPT